MDEISLTEQAYCEPGVILCPALSNGVPRPTMSMEDKRESSNGQFGASRPRSTVNAAKVVTDITAEAIDEKRCMENNKKFCPVIRSDIKNSFNLTNRCYAIAGKSPTLFYQYRA